MFGEDALGIANSFIKEVKTLCIIGAKTVITMYIMYSNMFTVFSIIYDKYNQLESNRTQININ